MTQESKVSKIIDKRSYIEKRGEKELTVTKVVVRKLPPSITPETFLEQVSPLPDYDFFNFVKADLSFGSNAFSRAYINFTNQSDVFLFRDKFDNYVFVDGKGNEYAAIVEFAPFQKVPKRKVKKPDSKKGTIEDDPEYIKFVETINNPEAEPIQSIDTYLEELEAKERELKANNGANATTPLIEYVKKKKEEKKLAIQRLRDERKKRDQERRKIKDEERRKKRDKEREKFKGGDRERKDSDRDSKEKDTIDERQKDKTRNKEPEHPMKLLKNPERDREAIGRKTEAKEEKPKEKLRFAKENRPSGRTAECSTPEKKSFKGNDERPVNFRDRPPQNRFGRDRDDRDKAGNGHNRQYGRDSNKQDRFGGRPGSARGGRDWDSGRDGRDRDSGRDGRDRDSGRDGWDSGRDGRDRDSGRDVRDRDSGRDGRDRDSGRDGRNRDLGRDGRNRDSEKDVEDVSGGHKDATAERPSEKPSRDRGDRYKNARDIEREKRQERERERMKERMQADRDGGKGDFSRGKGAEKNNDRFSPASSSSKRDTNYKTKVDSNDRVPRLSKASDSIDGRERNKGAKHDGEDDMTKRKRKDRPERQIYVPRKALERMQQDSKPKDESGES